MRINGSFEGKFYLFALLLYFVIWRIFWNIFQIVKLEKHAQPKPLISESKLSKTNVPRLYNRNVTLQMGTFKNTQIKNSTQKKKPKVKGRRINFRKKNFGNFDSWEADPRMKKVLLWTGYGPLQEGMLLWGRVLDDIVDGQCPESR